MRGKRDTEASKRVGIWIRVSTEDQVRGESPETHERRARHYAEAKGWNVVKVYRLDAVSGKTVKETPEAKQMLMDIKDGHITGLIFSKLARLARNTKELLEFAELFRESDADLISLAESIDTSTPAGRLFYTMIAAMAQWEREEIADRVAAAVPIRARAGKPTGGQAPFGYQWKDKQFLIDPKEAPVRKLMYELFSEHKRKKVVARLLNERGHRTRNGGKFSDTTVDRLLRDPSAKGIRRANYTKNDTKNSAGAWILKPEEEWVLIPVEPIVSEELWTECNLYLDGQRSRLKRPTKPAVHLFSGLTYCACGPKMYVPSNSPKYTCQKCRNKIPQDDLEAVFHEQIKSFLFSDSEIAEELGRVNGTIAEKSGLLSLLEQEATKLATEIDKLYDLYQTGMIDKIGFGAKYKSLAERRDQLDNQIPETQAEIDILKIAHLSQETAIAESRDLHSRWPELPTEEKRRIVEAITEKITVGDGEVEIKLYYAPVMPKRSGGGNASETGGGGLPPHTPSENRGNLATPRHGFIAATNWNRAGNSACRAARETMMRPDSSGSRSTSNTAL
jgi:site-specific DNA recombinase